MTTTIPPRDWETLSAYLDGQLNPKQLERLEGRLRDDVGLRSALDEIRRTSAILRSQPKLRAPHNFTLSPDMVGMPASRRATSRAYPILRFASVLISILFVVSMAGDLYLNTFSPARMLASQVVVQREADQSALPKIGVGGGEGNGLEDSLAPSVGEPVPEFEAVEAPKEEKSSEPELGAAANDRLQATPTITATVVVQATQTPPATPEPEALPSQVKQGWSRIRYLQIALGSLAVIAGLITFFLRRSMRP